MIVAKRTDRPACMDAEADLLPVPQWVSRLLGSCPVEEFPSIAGGVRLQMAEATHFALVSARIPDAIALSPLTFQRRTAEAYGAISRLLSGRKARYPVRFWNFIPHIQAPMGEHLTRYMVFNAGRFAAYTDWFGGENAFDQSVATATGIGHRGSDLMIHVLTTDRPGIHVNNPRQRRPRSYSRRHGPLPPCFARATVLPGSANLQSLILIGGTASVRGENSMHVDDLTAQMGETFRNLESLLRAACRAVGDAGSDPLLKSSATRDQVPWRPAEALMRLIQELRVYYLQSHHVRSLERMIQERAPHVRSIEFLRADICRPELLVEIEGLAETDSISP